MRPQPARKSSGTLCRIRGGAWSVAAWACGALALAAGCAPKAKFDSNLVHARFRELQAGIELAPATLENLSEVMTALFGTPDEPHLPQIGDVKLGEYLDIDLLKLAAGPVSREERGRPHGLFREHCVHCHGVTGDGLGPTAPFLNPYPRDYRAGLFKFKSTAGNSPPTHQDLHDILDEGIVGTSMPSFKLLDGNEREALVHYVKYLSIRGEVERVLLSEAANELDEGGLLVRPEGGGEDFLDVVKETVSDVVEKWRDAAPIEIPPRPEMNDEQLAASIEHGRKLFFGIGQCIKCHGETALGDGVENDYDNWTKELLVDSTKPESFATYAKEYAPLGALHPRPIQPRNLRLNVFRGGRQPIDIYRRIVIGITGAPMPAASMLTSAPEPGATVKGMTPDDVWDLVNYVRSLAYETASEPPQDQKSYQRDRPL